MNRFAIIDNSPFEGPLVQFVVEAETASDALETWYASAGARVMKSPRIIAKPFDALTDKERDSYGDRYGF